MMTKKKSVSIFSVLVIAATLSGCAAYRTSSSISAEHPEASLPVSTNVLIRESGLPGNQYKKIGEIDVSVKKLTIFHADPTKEQANEVLRETARSIGADAVINVKYDSGMGLFAWGYMDAEGLCVKLLE